MQPVWGWEHLYWGWGICWAVVATEPHMALGKWLWCGRGWRRSCRGSHVGVPQSQPPKVSTSTWGLGRQEKGTGPCGDMTFCPRARRSGWQTLPVLAAVTLRCRLALLPGASASMALLALLPGASTTSAPHPAPAPPRAGLRVRMLVGECIYTLSPAQSNKFQIKQK